MSFYRQRDYPDRLGWGPDSIAQDGCFLTEYAQLETWVGKNIDPPSLNRDWIGQGLFVACSGGGVECLTDTVLADSDPSWTLAWVRYCSAFPCPQDWLNNDDPNLFVLVHITNPAIGLASHFLAVVDWHVPSFADPWFGGGPRFIDGDWGHWSTVIDKVIAYRFGTAPAPAPAPAPTAPPGQFAGVVVTGGAHVRTLPGTDQPIVPQPGANPDLVDAGVTLNFGAWCVHEPRGGADVLLMDTSFNPPRPDKRWFETVSGHWVASVGIDYQNGADPPANLLVVDPNPPPVPLPPPPPAPMPVKTLPDVLKGFGAWETSPTYGGPANYAHLVKCGARYVLIRGANGDGTGSKDRDFEANWDTRAPLATAAGVEPVLWTYFYGPQDGPVTGDVAAYLMGCAKYTAGRVAAIAVKTKAIIVDVEDRHLPGLDLAVAQLSSDTGLPVVLNPPGDPTEYGLAWNLAADEAAVAALAPQLYTAAWQGRPDLAVAFQEWTGAPNLLPVFDEQDATKVGPLVQFVKDRGLQGFSAWYDHPAADAAMEAYGAAWSGTLPPAPPAPPPTPPPAPPPPVPPPSPTPPPTGIVAMLQWLIDLIKRLWPGAS